MDIGGLDMLVMLLDTEYSLTPVLGLEDRHPAVVGLMISILGTASSLGVKLEVAAEGIEMLEPLWHSLPTVVRVDMRKCNSTAWAHLELGMIQLQCSYLNCDNLERNLKGCKCQHV